jgi:two-component system sensor histidine kinase TctE
MIKFKTLKSGIIYSLIFPLVFFVAAETVLSYYVTLEYVDQAYDRWLLDSAKSLMQEVKVEEDDVSVELPSAAREIFTWDDMDKTYFKIISANKGILAGDSFVPEPSYESTDWSRPVFFNDTIRGQPVRVISILIMRDDMPANVFVHVAETLNKRRGMMTDILLADLTPQLLLTIFTGFYLLNGINRSLEPLRHLADEIARRSPRDLSPIPENQVLLEVRTLTDTINALLQRLASAILAQQRFISNAAHQLRTPLAGFKLQAERALREKNLTNMKPALQQMQNSADRMSHMVSQLLVLAKSETMNGGNHLTQVDICALAREICIDWAPKVLQRHMELSFEGLETALFIHGDKILLGEMLANLLDNALTYGHVAGNIAVKLERHPAPKLIVEDDGPGIPQSEHDKVFERFYRIQGSSGNGCGLGLAIVKEIADLHRARIELSRLPSMGGTSVAVIFEKRKQ